MRYLLVLLALVAGCSGSCSCTPAPAIPDAAPAFDGAADAAADGAPAMDSAAMDGASDAPSPAAGYEVTVINGTTAATTVYVAFGSDSAIRTWPFCQTDAGFGGCVFPLVAGASRGLPVGGKYLNATVSLGGNGCNATKAEINLNNPAWTSDTADVSLVDGYSNKLSIQVVRGASDGGVLQLGPPLGKDGNAHVFGLFPYGCDVCVARQAPPCGITPCGSPTDGGACGCKAGSQYNPAVPCQWSGPRGLHYLIELLP